MKYPIIVNENGDVEIFNDAHVAAAYLEPIDIKDNRYEFFDAHGYRVDATIVSDGVIRFRRRDPPVFDACSLAEILRQFLSQCGYNVDTGELGELVSETRKILGSQNTY